MVAARSENCSALSPLLRPGLGRPYRLSLCSQLPNPSPCGVGDPNPANAHKLFLMTVAPYLGALQGTTMRRVWCCPTHTAPLGATVHRGWENCSAATVYDAV